MGYLNAYRYVKRNYELPVDDLLLYVDAKEEASVEGDPVQGWLDLSGRGNDFAGIVGSRPVQVKSDAISFNGSQFLTGRADDTARNNITEGSWFCVFETNTTAVHQVLYAVGYSDSNIAYIPIFRIMPGGFLYYALGTGVATLVAILAPIEANKRYLLSGTWKRPEMTLYVNGHFIEMIDTATMLPGTLDSERIGSRNNNLQNFLDGDVSALLWYGKSLEEPVRKDVEQYLMNRFNI